MTAKTAYAIEASGLSKTYGKGPLAFRAVQAVDLALERGEVVMLCGPSGSGKTTLLSMIGCVLEPTEGDIALLGKSVRGLSGREMAHVRADSIGFVFQGGNLVAALTARQNVAFPLGLKGWSSRRALDEADRLLDRVALFDRREHLPRALSGGQRQRVSVARALAGSPPIVLADEPTAALDAATGRRVTALLRQMAQEHGTTVLIVSHDQRIEKLVDRIVHIEDGRITDGARGPSV